MLTCDNRLLLPVWLLLGLFTLSLPLAAAPVETPYGTVSLPFKLHQVPDTSVYYVIGKSGVPGSNNEGHTSNAGFVVTAEGVVVYDALGTPALGYRLLQRIREVTDKPVRKVIVSHYHADHIYGLQAFKQYADDPEVIAQRLALGYVGGDRASQGEAGQRRLKQRREVLFPWVDEKTFLVPPDVTFEKEYVFELGGLTFEVRHLGTAHAPGDSIMLVREPGVLFSGDVIYKGRIPFLDSPETDVRTWLKGLDDLANLEPAPRFIIPGHGEAETDVAHALAFTKGYLEYVVEAMRKALQELIPFDEAYDNTDWSRYKHMPAFNASNRGNAYRIYLELEPEFF
ncbi:MBL fold metallo-hydrolase [Sulfuriflexus sp.]|uniref:MBL fold metallo-hydrolase n=1 Tax=Sulfuriflexus sp. TaxID=2015443 RepID=UPI0028CBDB9A|nr:MBL fold metallo-hydrolase [Sulfuriflexus sp.]MDT8404781.1 MBL fold metallo-hydrolase [Sulfuriflexus sp.]